LQKLQGPERCLVFTSDKRYKNNTELIRSQDDLRAIYERKMRERQEFLDRYFVFGGAEYEPPMDYSRTRGLIGEMLAELRVQDEKRTLATDAAKKPPDLYAPQPAIGEAASNNAATGNEVPGSGDKSVVPTPGGIPPTPGVPAPTAAPSADDGDKTGQTVEPATAAPTFTPRPSPPPTVQSAPPPAPPAGADAPAAPAPEPTP
jgi:hypothetical protein